MGSASTDQIRETVDHIYREDSRRIFATLVRLLGDFDTAEEALHEAFAVAVEKWEKEGIPDKPVSWLVSTGRFRAIDSMRRLKRFESDPERLEAAIDPEEPVDLDEQQFRDDQLRLIFTCCHPALPPATQIAMTLREMCGLTTEEVASAFLTSPPTIAQRIVRGKAKIRDAGIPYRVPSRQELPERLDSVLTVVYLVFNEGYSASRGGAAIRHDLTAEAIRLGRLLLDLLPDPEVMGLLALMLLHDSRKDARTDAAGDVILLEDQDRSVWDQEKIAEGRRLVARAFASGEVGTYTIQAAISAEHAAARRPADTDWERIVELYDLLISADPSPIAQLNRAVAIAMRDGADVGLQLIDSLLQDGDLADYRLAHAARADLCRRLGRTDDARQAYERALALTSQEPERRFLERRLEEVQSSKFKVQS